MTPVSVLLAAGDTARFLLGRGAQITTSTTAPGSFRLEGTQAGQRLVIEVVFQQRADLIEAIASRQVGKSLKSRKATGVDHIAAALAAIGGLP